jgi:serine/threonine protein kinase
MSEHPTPDRLRQWREGLLRESERHEIEAHLETCLEVCQPLLDDLSDRDTPRTGPFRGDGQTGSAAPPSPDGYDILGEIGRGGMAVVYEARQRSLDRLVALKMLLLGDQAGPEDLTRFRSEAETIARMHHPNIVQVYEIGEHRGRMFLSLEHCPGGTLAERLNGGSPSPTDAAALVESLSRAVHHAHVQGVLHRDLKPANVLLVEGPKVPVSRCTPKISDFGLAKRLDLKHPHSQSGAIIGTPSYMAPEQALGKRSELGPEADVYGLGAILYECLTGRPPFQAEQPLDTILQVIADEPVAVRRRRPKVHLDLETICLRCLEKSDTSR